MTASTTTPTDLLRLSPVIPVVLVEELAHAVPVAEALVRGGIRVIELALGSRVTLAAIEKVRNEVPDIVVGAGNVISADHVRQAMLSGARFLVTPGFTERVLDAAQATGLPLLPGASTVSEAMRLAERGLPALKFFPAQPSGGVDYLRSISGPLPHLRFCPTGGITPENASRYLALSNVSCVGADWLTPKDAVAANDVGRIESLARAASRLGG